MPFLPAVSWSPDGDALRILDQRDLPARETFRDLRDIEEIVGAIRTLAIRGAPAIGVGAAIGLVVSLEHATVGHAPSERASRVRQLLPIHARQLVSARPTAVNLPAAIARMTGAVAACSDATLLGALRGEADAIAAEDAAMCRRIGEHGVALLRDGMRVLTHCNAGALATAGIGTALAPIYVAHERGMRVHVVATETRPLRQGARLTAWELTRAGIPVTVIPDSAAASLLASGRIDLAITGADRIARNGDTANKVGTYAHALAARAHGVPFLVAAPWTTLDLDTPTGRDIVVEERSRDELGELPAGADVWNPAFDVTPVGLITAFVTDRGIHGIDAWS